MSKHQMRDTIRLEPILSSVESVAPSMDAGLKVEKPFKSKKQPVLSDDSAPKQDLEIKRYVIVLASLLLLISSAIFAFDQLFSPDSFEVEELKISADLEQLSPEKIRQEILPLIQNNYFAVDLKHVEQQVGVIDWVDQVSVRREWPRSIHIRLSEQKPIAYWGEQGYLNQRANSFTVDQTVKIPGLPYLQGPEGTQRQMLKHYYKWKKLLAKKDLELDSLIMTPRYALEAKIKISRDQQKQLTNKALMTLYEEKKQPIPVLNWQRIAPFHLTLQLGKNDIQNRLKRFTAAFPEAFHDQVLRVQMVDLRYPNGFAVRWNETELPQDFLQLAVAIDEQKSKTGLVND